tara:strand:- start:211 stop:1191 length:981 start_codon:yes stop_codon:yes gene_type:complete
MLDKIRNKSFVILDGAMGTNLFKNGMISGECPELWNIENPQKIKGIHRSFVEAGSDIILTNTFGGNNLRLKLHQLESKVKEINRAGAKLAKQCAGRKSFVAGSIGPTGEILEPLGNLSYDNAVKSFNHQAVELAEGGVDLLWIETFSDINEVKAAVEGSIITGLPIVVTMSFDSSGKTMMGISPKEFISFIKEQKNIFAYGANCGLGFEELQQTIGEMKNAGGKNIVAKSNCGIPVFHDGSVRYNATEKNFIDYAVKVRNLGAKFIGGCCGTEPDHIKKIKEALEISPYKFLKYEKKESSKIEIRQKVRRRKRRSKINSTNPKSES